VFNVREDVQNQIEGLNMKVLKTARPQFWQAAEISHVFMDALDMAPVFVHVLLVPLQ
jgi:hypothetical protein